MSNQQEAVFVSDIFHMQSFWGGHGKISPRPKLVLKELSVQIFLFQQPDQVLMALAHKLLTV
jgi:hypothetical protein